jgi:hypothetical protein
MEHEMDYKQLEHGIVEQLQAKSCSFGSVAVSINLAKGMASMHNEIARLIFLSMLEGLSKRIQQPCDR